MAISIKIIIHHLICFDQIMNKKIRRIPSICDKLIRRLLASAFAKLILYQPQQKWESEGNIRHYDIQCEVVAQIAGAIESSISRKKAEVFFLLKFAKKQRKSRNSRPLCKSEIVPNKTCSDYHPEEIHLFRNEKLQKTLKKGIEVDCTINIFQKIGNYLHSNLKDTNPNIAKVSTRRFSKHKKVLVKLVELQEDFKQLMNAKKQVQTLFQSHIGQKSESSTFLDSPNPRYDKVRRINQSTAEKTMDTGQKILEKCDSEWTLG